MLHDTNSWDALERELDAWAGAGRVATLWWRDDDCVEPTPALDRLLAISAETAAPLALAVVPARLSTALPARLARAAETARVTLLQHGYAHRNHAPAGRKKQELDPERSLPGMLDELARGAARLTAQFGTEAAITSLPVLVPPWNRIDPRLPDRLVPLGFRGLSTDGPRPAAETVPGLRQANTHVDLLRAQRKTGTIDPDQVLSDLVGHLAARRRGEVDAEEPSGLLTHHLAHDAASWALLERLLKRLGGHGAPRFLEPAEVFACPAARPAARSAA